MSDEPHPFSEIFRRIDALTEKVEKAISDRKNSDGLNKDEYLKVEDAASFLGIEVRTLYDYTSKKKIRHYKPGSVLYFKKSDLEEHINSGQVDKKRKS